MATEQLEAWDKNQIPAAQFTFLVRWTGKQQEINSFHMENRVRNLDTNPQTGINNVDMPDSSRREGESFVDYSERLRQDRLAREAQVSSAGQIPSSESTPPSYDKSKNPQRRKLSKLASVILSGATLFGIGAGVDLLAHAAMSKPDNTPGSTSGPETPGNTPSPESTQSGEIEAKNGQMVLADNERVFFPEMMGYMNWTPDGAMSYWTTKEGKRRYLLTGGNDNATYMAELDAGTNLRDFMASGHVQLGTFKEVMAPARDNPDSWMRDYVGITGFIQDKNNADHLYGIAHGERRVNRDASGTYTATVGLLESFDGGSTWQDKGPLITGTDTKEPGGDRVSGAGQPSVVMGKDGYAYIMYIDWSASNNHPDQLYMSRLKVNDDATLGQVEYYTENGFSTNKDSLKSVIPVSDKLKNSVWMALPSLSFNTDLNKYMSVGECADGFWMSTSDDMVNWTDPKLVYKFSEHGSRNHQYKTDPNTGEVIIGEDGKPILDSLRPGEKWDSYPSAFSEDQPNSQMTGKTGIFYHSSGHQLPGEPHEPTTLDFTIQTTG